MKDLLIGLALLSCPAIVFAIFGIGGLDAFDEGGSSGAPFTSADQSRMAFAERCAGCHGRMAEGTDRGPALILPRYAPSRFGDQAFRRAVREGAPARHWNLGDMPAFPDLPERELDRMLTFVREIQHARGIH